MIKWYSNDNVMLLLNEQVKQTRNIFFARGTTAIKNNRSSSRKKLMHRTLNFYNHWALLYEIPEMADILSIGGEPVFDDRIVKFEFHTYNPYINTTFGHSDEIRNTHITTGFVYATV